MSDPMLDLVNAKHYGRIGDRFQIGAMMLVFVTIIVLDHLSKPHAKVAVFFFAAAILISALIGGYFSNKSMKTYKAYFDKQTERLKKL